MDFKTQLLTELLHCGYADISFLEKEMENFNVDFNELELEEHNINSIIGEIYNTALANADIDPFSDEWIDRISIFTNCLDSHLWIDGEEIHSSEEIEEVLNKEKDK